MTFNPVRRDAPEGSYMKSAGELIDELKGFIAHNQKNEIEQCTVAILESILRRLEYQERRTY